MASQLHAIDRTHASPYGARSPPSTCAAIGAATRPPVPLSPDDSSPPFSTSTAIAYRGASAGAKPMNHACACLPFDLRGTGLARDLDAGDLRGVPVPLLTTSTMRSRTVAAVSGPSALAVLVRLVASCRGSPRCRCSRRGRARAAPSSRRRWRRPCATIAISSGVTATRALADRRLREQRLVLLERARLRDRCCARRSGRRSVSAGRRADAEPLDARRERVAEVEPDLRERRVARHAERLARACRRTCSPPKFASVRSVCGRSSSFSCGYTGCRRSAVRRTWRLGRVRVSSLSRPTPVSRP